MSNRKALLLRFFYCLVIGIIIAAIFSEVSYRIQGNTTSRDPQTVELVIPAGTSQKVAQGEIVIPASQVFVVGDTLLVKNEDSVTQTLGPLVIPPGASASIQLAQIGNMSYTCSFQPTKYLGIQVVQALTFWMRLEGALLAGIPLGILIGVYSLVVKPFKPKSQPQPSQS